MGRRDLPKFFMVGLIAQPLGDKLQATPENSKQGLFVFMAIGIAVAGVSRSLIAFAARTVVNAGHTVCLGKRCETCQIGSFLRRGKIIDVADQHPSISGRIDIRCALIEATASCCRR